MSCGEVDGDDGGEVKGDDGSGVVATGNIGRLNGCSLLILRASRVATTGLGGRSCSSGELGACSSGELGASSSGELGGDIGCLVKNCYFDGMMEIMVEGQNLMEIPTEDLCFL